MLFFQWFLGICVLKSNWFHNQWVQISLSVFLPVAEKDWTPGYILPSKEKNQTGVWGVSRIPAKIKEGWKLKLEVIFLLEQETLWGPQRTLCSVCECLTREENMELWLCPVKSTSTSPTGDDGNPFRFPFAHFLGEMHIYPVTILYQGPVVCESSLWVEKRCAPLVLSQMMWLFRIVQSKALGPCSRTFLPEEAAETARGSEGDREQHVSTSSLFLMVRKQQLSNAMCHVIHQKKVPGCLDCIWSLGII